MAEMAGQDATTGWIEQLDELNNLLCRCRVAAEKIVYIPPVDTEKQAEPGCAADSLDLRLRQALERASELAMQLDRIWDRF